MTGIATLAELYLGAEPTGVTTENDHLLLHLSDGRSLALPLEFVSQLALATPQTAGTRLLVFSQPPRIDDVRVTEDALIVTLQDGRVLCSPLRWFPRLRYASNAERSYFVVLGDDDLIHWPELDEDIELLRLFSGGESLESEISVQGWLAEHRSEALVLNESTPKYDS
jgi:hypothetical protein